MLTDSHRNKTRRLRINMTLGQLIRSIATIEDELTIFVGHGEITEHSEIALVDLDTGQEPNEMRELIDVWHAREILNGVSTLNPELKDKTAEGKLIDRFIEYLRNDA